MRLIDYENNPVITVADECADINCRDKSDACTDPPLAGQYDKTVPKRTYAAMLALQNNLLNSPPPEKTRRMFPPVMAGPVGGRRSVRKHVRKRKTQRRIRRTRRLRNKRPTY